MSYRVPFTEFANIESLGEHIPVHTVAVMESHECNCGEPSCDGSAVQVRCSCGNQSLELVYIKPALMFALLCRPCHACCGLIPIDLFYKTRSH